jgi:DNA processing protein
MLSDMSLIERAEREMEFIEKNGIRLLCLGDEAYPYRLAECDDAPLVLHSMGNADLNAKHIVSIVGTRHASDYGKELCENFVADLARFVPGTLIVSGLAYGIDVCAHRAALKAGLPTIGVLAHGLDRIYPGAHRSTAKSMLENGGLLTEFMSGTNALPRFFVQRNRIVAGMSDATVVIESASKGGSLITASMAQGYARDCFAFPGRVYDQYSQGCNELVAQNKAALITCAYDFVQAMNWGTDTKKNSTKELQGELFPEMTEAERVVMEVLRGSGEGLQVNQMVVTLDMPINILMPLLFEMEMKGYIKAIAGGSYRALTP